ncbi:hypothetical protein EDC04DRAFT_3141859 [Pisolithus marmoratus]|nr:hypothetical protein EDC04DRAFT_3141859 [Pisolithus marmoratus]
MPQITYLLVQQEMFKVYEICNVHTTRDIPDSCKVEALMDHAAVVICDLMCLDSDKEVNVKVYMLLRPVDEFHGRSLYDIGNELGSIDQRFIASKVALLSPDWDIPRLDPDVLTGGLIIVFSVPWARRPLGTTNRRRDVLPATHELRDILVTPLVSSEKIPISEKMFMELVSDSSHDRCSPNDLSSLFRIGEPRLSFAMVYAAIAVPAYARDIEANFISFFRDTHRRPDFRFVVDGTCVFQGSEEGEPRNPEDPGKTSSNNFIWVCQSLTERSFNSTCVILGSYALIYEGLPIEFSAHADAEPGGRSELPEGHRLALQQLLKASLLLYAELDRIIFPGSTLPAIDLVNLPLPPRPRTQTCAQAVFHAKPSSVSSPSTARDV